MGLNKIQEERKTENFWHSKKTSFTMVRQKRHTFRIGSPPKNGGKKSMEILNKMLGNTYDRLIQKGESSIKINKGEFEKTVIELSGIHEKSISDLTDLEREKLDAVVRIGQVTEGTNAHSTVRGIISKHDKTYGKIIPKTVGAVLHGCHHVHKSVPGEHSCSAVCAGSLQIPDHDGNFTKCSSNVYILEREGKNSKISLLSKNKNNHFALIYFNDKYFDGLTYSELKVFKNNGITHASIYYFDSHSHHVKVRDYTEIDNLLKDHKDHHRHEKSGNNVGAIIVGIIIAIIIIGLLFWFFSGRSWSYGSKYRNSYESGGNSYYGHSMNAQSMSSMKVSAPKSGINMPTY